jgi:hypothetical protein
MSIDQSAVFLASSILTVLGFIIVFIGVVVINNILSKYWKPVQFIKFDYPATRFEEPVELQQPQK